MRWLIYGHAGWIGQQLLAHFNRLMRTGESPFLLENNTIVLGSTRVDGDQLEDEVRQAHPDRIICLVGRTSGEGCSTIDYLEKPGKLVENVRDNLYAPVRLALLCQKYGIHLTYLGTGCIFNYDTQHVQPEEVVDPNVDPEHRVNLNSEVSGFVEDDVPNYFDSSYSVVKGFTDRLMHELSDTVLNVRIRMPISAIDHPRNFISKIIRYQKICSLPNSMTVLDELLPIMLDMAYQRQTGTINLTNPGVITHNRILDLYRQIVDPSFNYQNFTLEEQRQVLKCGRSNNLLDTTKLEKAYPQVNPIETAIVKVLQNWTTESEKSEKS